MNDQRHAILYVDDDPDFLDAMRLLLEGNGYRMIAARTAEEGLRAAREQHPDLILVDLMMEEIDSGASLVRRMRAVGVDAPVYLLSSIGDQVSATLDARELGIAGVFQKPVDEKTLLETLRARLGPAGGG
ncbi:MAG: hypothetical protein Kow0062_23700 [Acidobacteriota bacterium]|nr:MAG: response regulator [Acidobacteriota bacterium]